ncbi:hypothetical protein BT93_E1408 [Corymbia citriodora subsp. variegata]|nr:hypothetical protein BT93_E1408 [Corymbia citriodora subsp. variegata]
MSRTHTHKRYSKSSKQWYCYMTIPQIFFGGCNKKRLFRLNHATKRLAYINKIIKSQKVNQNTSPALNKTPCTLQSICQMQDKSRKMYQLQIIK